MIYFVKKKIGSTIHTWEVQGKNMHACQTEAQKISFDDVNDCGLCRSTDLHLQARTTTEGFEYLEIICVSCRGQLQFGKTKKDPDVFFLKKNDDSSLAWMPFVNKKPMLN